MLSLAAPRTRLHSGAPWWLVRDGLVEHTASLRPDCDVVIVGAGITGALLADSLTEAGLDVQVVDRRMPAAGSTAATTALLLYELDTELADLISMVGAADAVRAYQLSAQTIASLELLSASLADHCGFDRRDSIYLAAERDHVPRLEHEAGLRDRYGLDVRFLTAADLESEFGLSAPAALVTSVAGVVDPVRLTRALLDRAAGRGATVVSWTTALTVEREGGRLSVETSRGMIRTDKVVLACGYEVPPCIEPSLTKLHSTYALITDPLENPGRVVDRCLVWESSRPYSYLRGSDGRVTIGGADLPHNDADSRDRRLLERTACLEGELRRLLPEADAFTAYAWSGTFGETRDGMPVIGPVSNDVPGVYFALGYGGNGLTFSMLAAEILRDVCLDRPNDDARIFRPDR